MVQHVTNRETFAANADEMFEPKPTGSIFSLDDISKSPDLRMAVASGRTGIDGTSLTNIGDGQGENNSKKQDEKTLNQIIIQDQIADLQRQLTNINEQLAVKYQQLALLQEELEAINNELELVQQEQQILINENTVLQEESETLEQERQEIKQKQEEITTQQEENADALKIAREETDEAKTKHESDELDVQRRQADLIREADLGKVAQKAEDLKKAENIAEKSRTEWLNKEVDIKKLEEIETELREKEVALQTRHDEIDERQETIAQELEENNAKREELAEREAELNERKATTEAEIAELEKEIKTLEADKSEIEQQIITLKNENELISQEELVVSNNHNELNEGLEIIDKAKGYIAGREGETVLVGDFVHTLDENKQRIVTDYIDDDIFNGDNHPLHAQEQKYTNTEGVNFNNSEEHLRRIFDGANHPLHSEVAQTAENNQLVKAGVLPETKAPQQSGLYDGDTTDPSNPNSPFNPNNQFNESNSSPVTATFASSGIDPGVNTTGTFNTVAPHAANSPVFDASQHPLHAVEQPETAINTAKPTVSTQVASL